jgi:protein-disulfide isomerase
MEEETNTNNSSEQPVMEPPTMSTSPASSNSDDGAITINKLTMWKVATFIFVGLFVLSAFGVINFGDGKSVTGAAVNNPTPTPSPTPTPGNLVVNIDSDDPVLGDKDAEITVFEFTDFECPFCVRAFTGAVTSLKNSDYFKNGEVNLAFKQFPLNSIHPDAQKAAEASLCAHDQGKFWEYHDLLFANQKALDITSLKDYGSQLGLDTSKFNNCLDNDEAADRVKKDLADAQAAGGRGTPYFVIKNKDGKTAAVSGAQPWENFETAIKSLQ